MNVLLLGSGGREHALGWKIAQSPQVKKLYIAPGNAGTADIGVNVNIQPDDFDAIKNFVAESRVDMVIVGPEAPLVNGIHDYFLVNESIRHVPVIGPGREGAKLEGSKEFAKLFMQRHHIPTAAYKSFTRFNLEAGYQFLESLHPPYVLKADGLAAGKGVVILKDLNAARQELKTMLLDEKFGEASKKVVIEEFLSGIELSVIILTDGDAYKILPVAKDYKRAGENDAGPNTGGMGAVSPVPFADQAFMEKVEEQIIRPTVQGLKKDDISYKGFIFFGLINVDGDPFVIEYNVRMGDPETEAVIPRIKSDLIDLLTGTADGTLSEKKLEIDQRTAVTLMLVSGGYPENYEKGKKISGIEQVSDCILFHAGTTFKEDMLITNGGRVMAVTALGTDMQEALEICYRNAEKIHFEHKNYRKDIGFDLSPSLL